MDPVITKTILETFKHKINGIRLHFGKEKLGGWNSGLGVIRMKMVKNP